MKSDDLISRSALVEYFEGLARSLANARCFNAADAIQGAAEKIKAAPAVDAEPVRHGYWIPQDNTYTKFMCSDCKGRNHDGSGKYCSECGCKMDAEVNNDGSNSAEY